LCTRKPWQQLPHHALQRWLSGSCRVTAIRGSGSSPRRSSAQRPSCPRPREQWSEPSSVYIKIVRKCAGGRYQAQAGAHREHFDGFRCLFRPPRTSKCGGWLEMFSLQSRQYLSFRGSCLRHITCSTLASTQNRIGRCASVSRCASYDAHVKPSKRSY
jgi:hypothetical protein